MFLGTSSAVPKPRKRNTSGMALCLSSGSVILVDCGEATQHQIMLTRGQVKMGKTIAILITHLHGDHCFGIFGLLCTLGQSLAAKPELACLCIVGPVGVQEMVETVLRLSDSHLPFSLKFIELDHSQGQSIDLDSSLFEGFSVSAYPLTHRIPAFGYKIVEPEKRGKFDVAKAKELGVLDNRLFRELTSGKPVSSVSGATVTPEQVLGPSRAGRKFLIVQDTCESKSIESDPSCHDPFLVIHEATYDKSLTEKCISHGHSTAEMAGVFARKIGARNLILTHFSSRYGDESEEESKEGIDCLIKECCEVYSSITGKIVAAQDFMVVDTSTPFEITTSLLDTSSKSQA